ncbi:MAG: ABC transporter ATP-binding protein [Bacillota bacterium]|nr:ABC transporter ATP-binding protein [Bacillota bacterium]
MAQPMIELHEVTKRFQQPVLRQVSFSVQPGEVIGLVGPNGAGKTTTIRLIAGVLRADGGSIRVAGRDPVREGDAIRRITGVLTESAGLYPHLSGLDNLRFFAEIYGVTDSGRPAALLEEFGLGAHADRKVAAYSTGMRKRLGLAKALLHRPALLLLDEPTSGLDPEGIRMVLEDIGRWSRNHGTTIVLSSHVLQQLEAVCHRYVFLDGGRVIEQGTLGELEMRHRTETVLEVETDLPLEGDRYEGFPVRRLAPGRLEFRLGSRRDVPELLRRLLRSAEVYSAVVADRDLQSLYFKIREDAARGQHGE